MHKTKSFQDATESLNQINLWQKKLEDKELRMKFLIEEKEQQDYLKQIIKENHYRLTPSSIRREPGLW